MLPIPELLTERTLITLLKPEEAPLIHAYYLENRSHLEPWEPEREGSFYQLNSWRMRVKQSLNLFIQGRALRFAILDPERKEMLGSFSFTQFARGPMQHCTMGYSVGSIHQGSGIMFEAGQSAIDYVFSELDMHRIMANYLPRNMRSEKLLMRWGFEREGLAKSYLKINGQWEDHVLTAKINPGHL